MPVALRPRHTLARCQHFAVPLPDPAIILAEPRFVVVNKPAGMLSVPGKGQANQDCVASRVQAMFPQATGPLIVHRLDMDTSGLMVLALDPEAHRLLSAQFEHRATRKRYIAIVAGVPDSLVGEINLPIRPDISRRPRQIVDHALGKPSLTRFRVLRTLNDHALIELEPVTGRTHQLRIHLSERGWPILGDVLYAHQAARDASPRLALHAAELDFNAPDSHPVTPRRVRCVSPAPFDLDQTISSRP